MDYSKREEYEKEMEAVRPALDTKELTKEQCLQAVEHMEMAKFDVQVRMYDFVKMQKDNPSLINSRVRTEEIKQSDILFLKTGIEEADVEPSIERLGLKEDDDYNKIINEWKEKSQAFLQAKAREGTGDHSAADAQRARQRIALQQKQLEERKAARAKLNAERVEKSKQLNIGKPNLEKKDKQENAEVALGTSKINYMDPRITISWCKRKEVPIEKVFPKSLRSKFAWAMDNAPEWRF